MATTLKELNIEMMDRKDFPLLVNDYKLLETGIGLIEDNLNEIGRAYLRLNSQGLTQIKEASDEKEVRGVMCFTSQLSELVKRLTLLVEKSEGLKDVFNELI